MLGRLFVALTIPMSGLVLSGCDTDFISVCYSCVEGDPAQPVPADEIKKIGIIGNGEKIPESAKNVYYYEECGIDCIQYIRFDLPTDAAIDFAEAVRPLNSNPIDEWSWPQIQSEPLPWWSATCDLTGEILHSQVEVGKPNDPLIDFIIVKEKSGASVLIKSWNM